MTKRAPRYSKEEFARRGDEIYAKQIHPLLAASDVGKYVLIDVETGEYEMDADEIAASDRLLARLPDAQVWMVQVGYQAARRFGRFLMANETTALRRGVSRWALQYG